MYAHYSTDRRVSCEVDAMSWRKAEAMDRRTYLKPYIKHYINVVYIGWTAGHLAATRTAFFVGVALAIFGLLPAVQLVRLEIPSTMTTHSQRGSKQLIPDEAS